MAKGTTVFIATIIFIMSIVVSGVSAYGMGINNKDQESASYKTALSFVIISTILVFITTMILSYHATKLYCD